MDDGVPDEVDVQQGVHITAIRLPALPSLYGDSGVTEEVRCFDTDYYAYDEHKPLAHDAAHLQEYFETLVPMGYENDCGGFGDVVLDVAARKITVERNDRFEDYTTSTYEV